LDDKHGPTPYTVSRAPTAHSHNLPARGELAPIHLRGNDRPALCYLQKLSQAHED